MKTSPTSIIAGSCTAQRCDGRAVNLCPGCGMALCAACLARHAHFPTAGNSARRQSRPKRVEREAQEPKP